MFNKIKSIGAYIKNRFNLNPSITKTGKKVEAKSPNLILHCEDPRVHSLSKIIHLQGSLIVFLLFALIISVGLHILDVDITIPNQTALQTAPPLELSNVDYNALVYQGERQLKHASVINEPNITIIGQIYDGQLVAEKWPDAQILVNNAIVPHSGPNSQFKINLKLSPGPNIIETALRINGILYNRRQKVINYEPQASLPANITETTDENISTQATVPTGR